LFDLASCKDDKEKLKRALARLRGEK
jgi:hypothetical protein